MTRRLSVKACIPRVQSVSSIFRALRRSTSRAVGYPQPQYHYGQVGSQSSYSRDASQPPRTLSSRRDGRNAAMDQIPPDVYSSRPTALEYPEDDYDPSPRPSSGAMIPVARSMSDISVPEVQRLSRSDPRMHDILEEDDAEDYDDYDGDHTISESYVEVERPHSAPLNPPIETASSPDYVSSQTPRGTEEHMGYGSRIPAAEGHFDLRRSPGMHGHRQPAPFVLDAGEERFIHHDSPPISDPYLDAGMRVSSGMSPPMNGGMGHYNRPYQPHSAEPHLVGPEFEPPPTHDDGRSRISPDTYVPHEEWIDNRQHRFHSTPSPRIAVASGQGDRRHEREYVTSDRSRPVIYERSHLSPQPHTLPPQNDVPGHPGSSSSSGSYVLVTEHGRDSPSYADNEDREPSPRPPYIAGRRSRRKGTYYIIQDDYPVIFVDGRGNEIGRAGDFHRPRRDDANRNAPVIILGRNGEVISRNDGRSKVIGISYEPTSPRRRNHHSGGSSSDSLSNSSHSTGGVSVVYFDGNGMRSHHDVYADERDARYSDHNRTVHDGPKIAVVDDYGHQTARVDSSDRSTFPLGESDRHRYQGSRWPQDRRQYQSARSGYRDEFGARHIYL